VRTFIKQQRLQNRGSGHSITQRLHQHALYSRKLVSSILCLLTNTNVVDYRLPRKSKYMSPHHVQQKRTRQEATSQVPRLYRTIQPSDAGDNNPAGSIECNS